MLALPPLPNATLVVYERLLSSVLVLSHLENCPRTQPAGKVAVNGMLWRKIIDLDEKGRKQLLLRDIETGNQLRETSVILSGCLPSLS